MATFRVQLAQGDKKLKTDLKAADEHVARTVAREWFDDARWQIVEIRRLAD